MLVDTCMYVVEMFNKFSVYSMCLIRYGFVDAHVPGDAWQLLQRNQIRRSLQWNKLWID